MKISHNLLCKSSEPLICPVQPVKSGNCAPNLVTGFSNIIYEQILCTLLSLSLSLSISVCVCLLLSVSLSEFVPVCVAVCVSASPYVCVSLSMSRCLAALSDNCIAFYRKKLQELQLEKVALTSALQAAFLSSTSTCIASPAAHPPLGCTIPQTSAKISKATLATKSKWEFALAQFTRCCAPLSLSVSCSCHKKTNGIQWSRRKPRLCHMAYGSVTLVEVKGFGRQ